jgi:hypothetical protein
MNNEQSLEIFVANAKKGFWDDQTNIIHKMNQINDDILTDISFTPDEVEAVTKAFTAQKLMLVVSELSEALEADRKSQDAYARVGVAREALNILDDAEFKDFYTNNIKGTVNEELADANIRINDINGGYNLDLETHQQAKLRFNLTRPFKHSKKY